MDSMKLASQLDVLRKGSKFLFDSNIIILRIDGKIDQLKEMQDKGMLKDVYCLMICERGRIKISIEGGVYDLSEGDLCIYTPERNFKVIETTDNIRALIVGGTNNYLHNAIYSVFSAERVLYMQSNPTFHLEPEQREKLFKLIESGISILEEARTEEAKAVETGIQTGMSFISKTINSLVEMLCFYVLHLYSRSRMNNKSIEEISKTSQGSILQKFMVSLYYNYTKERSVEFYAEQQGLSKRYFSTAIRQESGKSPKQWIERIVIEEIKHYLSDPNMTVKEVSYHFNFRSQSFFGKYFKQSVGMSPKEYKDMIINKTVE